MKLTRDDVSKAMKLYALRTLIPASSLNEELDKYELLAQFLNEILSEKAEAKLIESMPKLKHEHEDI